MGGKTPDLRRESYKLLRIPEDMLLQVALRKLKDSGEHMGVVLSSGGAEVGLFTLEDIVEELIGDVRDEFEPSCAISISEILGPETVLLDPDVRNRAVLIELLVRRAFRAAQGIDPEIAIETVLKRERAVPPRSQEVSRSPTPGCRNSKRRSPRSLAFARRSTTRPPDGRPVHLVLLILTPPRCDAWHTGLCLPPDSRAHAE
jgi:hypothetical protein